MPLSQFDKLRIIVAAAHLLAELLVMFNSPQEILQRFPAHPIVPTA